VTSDDSSKPSDRGRRVMEQMHKEGTVVRDTSCVEEVVFPAHGGPCAVAVHQLNARAGMPVSRIVEVIVIAQD
jgi:hypothetical protein